MTTQTIIQKQGEIALVTLHHIECQCGNRQKLALGHYSARCRDCGATYTIPDRYEGIDQEIEADADDRTTAVAPFELRAGDRFNLKPYGRCQVVRAPEGETSSRVLVKVAGGEITEILLGDGEWLDRIL